MGLPLLKGTLLLMMLVCLIVRVGDDSVRPFVCFRFWQGDCRVKNLADCLFERPGCCSDGCLLVRLQSRFVPLFAVFTKVPTGVVFNSLGALIAVLPRPAVLLSNVFMFLPVFASFPARAYLPVSVL